MISYEKKGEIVSHVVDVYSFSTLFCIFQSRIMHENSHPEVYLEPCRTSIIEPFVNIVNGI